jgi:hypothetical protein
MLPTTSSAAVPQAEERDVYDSFYILMAKMLERAFEGQFHFGACIRNTLF